MALDSDYFRLSAGLESAWAESENFTSEYKQLVASAIPGVTEHVYPHSEAQLDQLQMAIVASNFLRSFENEKVEWLSEASRKFPQAFRVFIYEVAVYFHDSEKELPSEFMKSLALYIEDSKSHIAVLNYDNLLYDALTEAKTLRGFSGPLIDGFLKSGFDPENLERRYKNATGWYMHLHGSPLFIGNQKLMRGDRSRLTSTTKTSHIVLTHVKHKPSIIDSSAILREYWNRFDQALDETSRVIIFGYSGEDLHLNDKVSSRARPVSIVEWGGIGGMEERKVSWERRLPRCSIQLHHLENILDFEDWDSL